MACPRCGRRGRRTFKGYCTKVHQDLDRAPKYLQLECSGCGSVVVRAPSQVSKGGKVYCSRCPKNSGESHYKWQEGQYLNPAGYRLVLISGEYKLEHRATWEQANQSCILPEGAGKVSVHHINFIKTDNRPSNLVLLTNQEHGRIHRFIDNGRLTEAKSILLRACLQQAHFISNPDAILEVTNLDLGTLNDKD